MAAEPMSHELTDEALAKRLWIAAQEHQTASGYPALPDLDAAWANNRGVREYYRFLVRAVRAALLPAVPPLAPGETVTIPDAYFVGTENGVHLSSDGRLLEITVEDAGIHHAAWLDAAGVAQLERACQRWLAAQNETAAVKTG